MSVALMKTLMFGQDFELHAPADVFFLYNEWKSSIKADAFNPLIHITGGMSFVTGHDEENRSLQAVMFSQDWLHKCQALGAGTKNAAICLASNFDDQMGIVAMSLEMAMIATKPRTDPAVRIDLKVFVEIVNEIFLKDYAGIKTAMSEEWGVRVKEGLEISPKRTRSTWREELGYDVLIHPLTLEPCKDGDGSVLEYHGTVQDKTMDKCFFKFTRRATGEEILLPSFPPV